jgi:ATP-dependent RNA helicase DeaD
VGSVNRTNQLISHEYTLVKGMKKLDTLMRIFDADESMRGIVFCRTKSVTQKLADVLKDKGYGVEALHGDLTQSQRDSVMNRFRRNNINIVIATDVASRGIDVYDLNRIIHFDMPENSVNYTHRSGRTARAGKSGFSLVFVPPSGAGKLRHFEQQLKIKFKEAEIPSEREITILRMKKWASKVVDSQMEQRMDPSIYGEVFKTFTDLSKEEIIEKFVMNWVSGLKNPHVLLPKIDSKKANQTKNKNDRHSQSNHVATGREAYKNYYINLGYIDGITKRDMVELLCGVTGLKRHSFKNIEIHQKYTLFDAQTVTEKTLISQMKGLKIGKRKIRVNRNHK